jgi:hypothetical protein
MGFDEWWQTHDSRLQEHPRRLANAAWNGGIDIAREDAADSLREWPIADLLLHCGEMTANEQRSVRSVLEYLAWRLRHNIKKGEA